MKTSSLEVREKPQLPPAHARATLQVMEAELAVHESVLATKADLRQAVQTLRTDMQTLRTKIQTQRGDVVAKIRGTVRWNSVFWVTQLAAMAAILKALK